MFDLREYIMDGLMNAIGEIEDYEIILLSLKWFDKKVLLEKDLAEIDESIKRDYKERSKDE